MAIQVICPGCHTRFKVGDQFAGKKGPCPKCKHQIEIPKSADEVKIHGPQTFGPKGKTGEGVLKPIFREETKFDLKIAGIIAGAVVALVIVAAIVGGTLADKDEAGYEGEHTTRMVFMALGAILVAPPLVFGGYTFLRDQELQPYRGRELWIRVGFCAAAYAVLWVLVAIMNGYVQEWAGFSMPMLLVLVAIMVAIGAGAAYASLDLDYATGLFHYGMYFGACLLLRLIAIGDALPLEET